MKNIPEQSQATSKSQPSARQWISVEERLPEPFVSVVLAIPTWKAADKARENPPEYHYEVGWLQRSDDEDVEVLWGTESDDYEFENVTHWQPSPASPNFPQSSSLVSQGAESADIGKLEAADEKMCKCGHSDEEHDDGRLCCTHRQSASLMCLCDKFAGSAETGGEKAAFDEKRLRQILELERIKVAKGVQVIREVIHGRQWLPEEGRGPYSYDDERYQKEFGYALNEISAALKPLEAIAGDLSDCPVKREEIQECWKLAKPSPESREPEKLNNAQNEKSDREFLERLLDTLRNSANRFQREGMSHEEVNHQILELESRLAESSLSSPPPEGK